jgi:hypothetical protein
MAGTGRALYHSRRSCPGRRRRPSGSVWGGAIASLTWDADVDAGVVTVTGRLPTMPPRTVVPLSVRPALGETLAGLARERISSTGVVRTRLDLGQHGPVHVIGRSAPEPTSWSGWRRFFPRHGTMRARQQPSVTPCAGSARIPVSDRRASAPAGCSPRRPVSAAVRRGRSETRPEGRAP